MIKEYFIVDLKSSDLNFNCFSNPYDAQSKVDEVFTNENCKWTNSQSSSGTFLQALYETELAHIKIEIMKTKKELPYIFHLTVLGGSNPLYEVARLCKLNSWNAYDAKTSEYLNLKNQPKLDVKESDKKQYYDDFWDKMNDAQEEQIANSIQNEERSHKNQSPKKWWKFW